MIQLNGDRKSPQAIFLGSERKYNKFCSRKQIKICISAQIFLNLKENELKITHYSFRAARAVCSNDAFCLTLRLSNCSKLFECLSEENFQEIFLEEDGV